jgi:uncharacterized protein YukE
MSEPLEVTPDGLRATSDHLEDASDKVKQVLTALNAKLEAEGPAWGHDSTGNGFANGPDGYLAQLDWVNSSIGAKTKLLDGYSESLRNTANTLEAQDEG